MNFDIIYCRFSWLRDEFLAARKIRAFYWREYGGTRSKAQKPFAAPLRAVIGHHKGALSCACARVDFPRSFC